MNRTAIVTGGNRGIGKAIASDLAAHHYNVMLTYNTQQKEAQILTDELNNRSCNVIFTQLDLSIRESIINVVDQTLDAFGSVDVLVNNAAISQEKPFEQVNDKDWDNMMAINLRGPYIFCQEVIPLMIKRDWGRIINIASIGGQWGGFNQVHYAAAKAGLINLTKSLARIYGKNGITVNSISPGLVDTDMIKNEIQTIGGMKKLEDIPLGRIAVSSEIAGIVTFLASNESGYITGQTISVNGGMYFG